jgi:hypothetical protein
MGSQWVSGAASGAASGFAMGGPWGAAIGGVAGGLMGAFGGSDAKVDTSGITNASQDYLNFAKDNYANPNSSYYNQIGKKQFNNLNDMYLAGMNKSVNQMYAQGVSPSAKLTGDYTANASATAGEQANQFQTDMYGRGMQQVGDAYKTNVQAQESAAGLQAGISGQNAKMQDEMQSGFTGMGMNLLGQYFQGLQKNNRGGDFASGTNNLPSGSRATANLYNGFANTLQYSPFNNPYRK